MSIQNVTKPYQYAYGLWSNVWLEWVENIHAESKMQSLDFYPQVTMLQTTP
jgi:hypothetical protein